MSEESQEWLEFNREWVDEQMAADRAKDEAAFSRFMQKLLGPLDRNGDLK